MRVLAKLRAGALEASRGRLVGDPEVRRDLGEGVALGDAHEDVVLRAGEPRDRGDDRGVDAAVGERAVDEPRLDRVARRGPRPVVVARGVGPRRDSLLDVGRVELAHHVGDAGEGALADPLAPVARDERRHHDPREPRAGRHARDERVPDPERFEEGLLHHVVGDVAIAREAEGDPPSER